MANMAGGLTTYVDNYVGRIFVLTFILLVLPIASTIIFYSVNLRPEAAYQRSSSYIPRIPTSAPSCTFKATNYIKDENGNYITEMDGQPGKYGTANDKQALPWELAGNTWPSKPPNTAWFDQGQYFKGYKDRSGNPIRYTYSANMNFAPQGSTGSAQYKRGDLAKVVVYLDNQNWGVAGQECTDFGMTKACPVGNPTSVPLGMSQPQPPIIVDPENCGKEVFCGLKIDCGVNVSYGWILTKRPQ